MRNREVVIDSYINVHQFESHSGLIEILIANQKLILEVLLDIRDKI